jgi:cytoskeletal protein CcmA (bactofilin family)
MWPKKNEAKPAPPSAFAAPSPPSAAPVAERVAAQPDESPAAASRIGRGISISGTIAGREDICIEGECTGNIRVEGGRVIIGTCGRVRAEIEADQIIVEGRVEGSLAARSFVRIGRGGWLVGDIVAPRLAVEEGAVLHSRVDLTSPASARSAGEPAAAAEKPRRALAYEAGA